MVIDPNNSLNNLTAQRSRTDASGVKSGQDSAAPESLNSNASAERDSVSLSDRSKTLSALESTVRASDGVDQRKVDALRIQIANGEYNIDSRAIAEKFIESE